MLLSSLLGENKKPPYDTTTYCTTPLESSGLQPPYACPAPPSLMASKQPPVAARPAITGLVVVELWLALIGALPAIHSPPQQPLNAGTAVQVMLIGSSAVPWATMRPLR